MSVVGITRSGAWVGGGASLDEIVVVDPQGGALPHIDDSAAAVDIAAALDVDVVFPVLHGAWGEDGTVQGLLEMHGVPYVGSGVLASALAMDKGFMKTTLRAVGLPVGNWTMVTDREWREHREAAIARIVELGFPVFVKPARAGSSRGISKVHSVGGLANAIEVARQHDPRVIVEAGIEGMREIECGVLAGVDGSPQASRCAEIIVGPGHEFYDFDAKYLEDSATLVVPTELAPDIEAQVRDLSCAAFEALDCAGLARVDVFVRGEEILINELNTMPGFTSISMFPRMWAASGVDYVDLVNRLVADALRRGTGLT